MVWKRKSQWLRSLSEQMVSNYRIRGSVCGFGGFAFSERLVFNLWAVRVGEEQSTRFSIVDLKLCWVS